MFTILNCIFGNKPLKDVYYCNTNPLTEEEGKELGLSKEEQIRGELGSISTKLTSLDVEKSKPHSKRVLNKILEDINTLKERENELFGELYGKLQNN